MRKNWLTAIIFGASLALAAPVAFAQGEGHGHGHDKGHRGDQGNDNAQGNEDHGRWGPRFSHDDQVVIEAYFHRGRGRDDHGDRGDRGDGERGLPQGLAKRGGYLPPGLERQLRERGTLPPGLQRRCEPLPYDLDRRLPRLPYGYRRVMIGGDILIVNRTWVISGIIRGVIR